KQAVAIDGGPAMFLVVPAVVKEHALAVRIIDDLVPAGAHPAALLVGVGGLVGGVLEFDPRVGGQPGQILGAANRRAGENYDQRKKTHRALPLRLAFARPGANAKRS